jgi:hypothetical protein
VLAASIPNPQAIAERVVSRLEHLNSPGFHPMTIAEFARVVGVLAPGPPGSARRRSTPQAA